MILSLFKERGDMDRHRQWDNGNYSARDACLHVIEHANNPRPS